ncbi:hypothetical protein MHU86_14035 [Fragilaria crotonensis]|nr:hypothetical protein MHU86_14035 [Fragilaria crotonensis]
MTSSTVGLAVGFLGSDTTGTPSPDIINDGSMDGPSLNEGRPLGNSEASTEGDGEGRWVGYGEGFKEGSLDGLTVLGSGNSLKCVHLHSRLTQVVTNYVVDPGVKR